MASTFARLKHFLINFERTALWHLGLNRPPDGSGAALAFNCDSYVNKHVEASQSWSVEDIFNDPFVWAVPRHRRSIYVRRQRRFGSEDGFWKMIRTKDNLIICTECGGHKEAGRLCPTCYQRVKAETEEMQEKIQQELGLSPVDKEVVVLYDGEQAEQKSEFWNGKRVVEMKKPRPNWFSKNLLQQSTQAPAKTTAVEPKDLA